MFKGLFRKIWAVGILCSVLAVCLVLLGVVSYFLKLEAEEMLQRGYLLVQVMTHEIESGYLKGIWPYKTLKMVSEDEDVSLLWIVKPDGEIFWTKDSETIGRIFRDPFLSSEELKSRDSNFQGEKVKLIAHPIKIELKEKPWTLFLGISFKQLRKAQRDIIFLSAGFFVLTSIFIGFIAFHFSKKITNPLKLLTKDLAIIGKGNLNHRVKIKTGDEIEEMGRAINAMAEDLRRSRLDLQESKTALEIKVKARTKELEELTKSLEDKVEERTKELQKRIEELEKFHRLTVGRELKMIELKKEIERLKKELEKYKGRKKYKQINANSYGDRRWKIPR